MFYFNSWFNFAIYYFGGLVAAGVLCTAWPVRATAPGAETETPAVAQRWRAVRLAAVCIVAITGLAHADLLRIHDFDADKSRVMHASVERALTVSDTEHPAACRVLCFPPDDWPAIVGVGLQITRAGEKFVTFGRWLIAFGADHGWRALDANLLRGGLCPWYVVPTGTHRPGVAEDAPVYPLMNGAELSLTPPTLDLSATVGSAAEINFAPGGNAADFILIGWGSPDPGGTWSTERWAALAFRPPAVDGKSVTVTVEGDPFILPARGLKTQRVRLFFNGQPIGPGQGLSAGGSVAFTIPAPAWNSEASKQAPVASLVFELPDAASPASLDPSGRMGTRGPWPSFFTKCGSGSSHEPIRKNRCNLPNPPHRHGSVWTIWTVCAPSRRFTCACSTRC